jgi:RNA methyltransferase, TrmH family
MTTKPEPGSPSEGRLSPAEERLVIGLRRRAVREERGLFLAEGLRVVEDLLRSPIVLEFAVVGDSATESEREQAAIRGLEARCPVRRVPDGEIRRLAATDSPQGLIATGRIPDFTLDAFEPAPHALTLALDGVQDPGNFGALVRSARAFGSDLILALTGTVDPWNPKAVRAAAGASFHVHIASLATETALTWLRAAGFAIFAADARGEPIDRVARPERLALVVGNEGAGVGQIVHSTADARVAVPIRPSAESLNVAVAAGILLYALTRETGSG